MTLELGKHDDPGLIKEIAGVLKNGGIAVIPTDTIYGIVGPAENPKTVEKIYKLRKRTSTRLSGKKGASANVVRTVSSTRAATSAEKRAAREKYLGRPLMLRVG